MAEYIEREALLSELAKGTIISSDLYGMGIMSGVDFATKKITAQPAADVAPVVHGRWEPHPHAYGYERCSVCNDCNICGEWADGKKWNYCPNCGAKMDKEEIK